MGKCPAMSLDGRLETVAGLLVGDRVAEIGSESRVVISNPSEAKKFTSNGRSPIARQYELTKVGVNRSATRRAV